MLNYATRYFFSLKSIFFLKEQMEPKLTCKQQYLFLTKNLLIEKRINNTLSIKKNYKSNYKALKRSYYFFLQNLVLKPMSVFSLFFFLLQKDLMYNNLSYSLYFWGKPLNILFRMDWVKKNNNAVMWIRYIKFKRRFLLIWRWLAILFKFYKITFSNRLTTFFFLWKTFFLKSVKTSKLNLIKLRVYKIYLYKLY